MIKRQFISFITLISVIIMLTGCAPPMYIVSVVDRSPKEEPLWLSQQIENEIVGIGEHKYKKTAYDEAIKDLQMRIASEIGIEVGFESLIEKSESGEEYSETVEMDLDIIGDAILQEIHTCISATYWEHCRAQTGRKTFNDFYRYHVKANIPPGMIDTLRSLTINENNLRLETFNQSLSRVDSLAQVDVDLNPVDLLREYVATFELANTLFYDKRLHSRTCLNRIKDIVNDFRINLITPYSEVRPTRHYMEYEVKYKNKPVEDVNVGFQLDRKLGSVTSSDHSNANGVVRCDVYKIAMNRSNQVVAYLDLADPLDQLFETKSPVLQIAEKSLTRTLHGIACPTTFSSQAQKAIVRGGSLELKRVTIGWNSIYRRVKDMDCSLYLEETNGRSVKFHNYDVKVKCWIQTILDSRAYTDQREGSFGISPPLELQYNQRQILTLPNSKQIARKINELKSAHEIGMRQVQISIRLYGTDDAGNDLCVDLTTDRIPWLNLFEK